MSTLQKALVEQRGVALRGFIRRTPVDTPVHTLAVLSWRKRSWHFPWSCLTRFEHDGGGTPETLRIVFGEFEVVVEGARLGLLLSEISSLRLDSIRELPPGAALIAGENEPAVGKVTVRKQTDRPVADTETS